MPIVIWHNEQMMQVDAADAEKALGPDFISATPELERYLKPYTGTAKPIGD